MRLAPVARAGPDARELPERLARLAERWCCRWERQRAADQRAAGCGGDPEGSAAWRREEGPRARTPGGGDDSHLRKLAALPKPNPNPGDPSNYAGTNKQTTYTIRNAPGANIYMTTAGMASATA
jgi:hypothetical protein